MVKMIMADELACFLWICTFQKAGWLMCHLLLAMKVMVVMVTCLTAFRLIALAYGTTNGSAWCLRLLAGCCTSAHAKQQLQQGVDCQVCLHLHGHPHQPRPWRLSRQGLHALLSNLRPDRTPF